jgi:DNA-3-methyladenine glycosylase
MTKTLYKKLSKTFYIRPAQKVAKDLIGKIICRKKGNDLLSGIIVEAEAYPGKFDPASHSFIGKTKRNSALFDEGGKAYVYFTYGNHFCFNVVSGLKNQGNGVLIRAVEPLEGIEIMSKNRKIKDIFELTNGPGKLAKAFDIDGILDGEDLCGEVIFLAEPVSNKSYKVLSSKRIGISRNVDKLYRFYMKDNPYVSGSSKALRKLKHV